MFKQRKLVLAVLLLSAPLAALGGPESTTPRSAAAGEFAALDLTAPRISELLIATPFQVFVHADELLGAESVPVIVVRDSHLVQSWSVATEPRCGLGGIAWTITHPANAWREVALLPAGSSAPACLRSAAAIEHIPAALAPVRWYQ